MNFYGLSSDGFKVSLYRHTFGSLLCLAYLTALSGVLIHSSLASYDEALADLKSGATAQGLAKLHTEADCGNPNAMRTLGACALNGIGGPKNPAEAVGWFEKGAQAKDAGCMAELSLMYLSGDGVERDLTKCRAWALKGSEAQDPGARLVYFLSVLNGPELNYRINGQPNMEIYNKLANRAVADRSLDIKAFTYLALAAQQRLPGAQYYIVVELLDKVGPGNRTQALDLMKQYTRLPDQFQKIQKSLIAETALGESYTNPTTFNEAYQNGSTAALIHFPEVNGPATAVGSKPPNVQLVATAISKPLKDSEYLPITEKPLDRFFLLHGNWEETWTFAVNGQTVAIPIQFQADGFGGAYVTAKGSPPAK